MHKYKSAVVLGCGRSGMAAEALLRSEGVETLVLDESTYLMAPVHVVETFECFNLNPQKLELLLHKFFGKVCLEVDVFDQSGKRFTPREWFIAPLPVIEEAIELIISGEVVGYVYDEVRKIVCRRG